MIGIQPLARPRPSGERKLPGVRFRIALAIAFASAACLTAGGARAQADEPPLPEVTAFLSEVKARLQLNQTALNRYTYQQKNTQKHLDKEGRVKKTETRLFEVFPHEDGKLTYRRLIEKDGRPVPEKELQKQDRDYEKDRAKSDRKRKKADPEKEEKARREEREAVDEAFRAFDIVLEGRELIEGRPALRFSLQPNPDADVKSREVKILRNFAGRVWFDEELHELVRLDLEAVRDVKIGFGMVAKLRKGATASLERRFLNNEVWLPSRTSFSGDIRLLLVKGMRMEVADEFFDFRRFGVETSVSFDP